MGTIYVRPEFSDIGSLTYDQYCSGVAGGPTLDYWWKLDSSFPSSSEANFGAGGAENLVLRGSAVGVSFEQTGIVNTTADFKSIQTEGSSWSWLNANGIRVDGSQRFTAGGWVYVPTGAGDQLLFRSSMGGTQGYWRGLDVLLPSASEYLSIVLGTNSMTGSKFFYRLQTTNAVVSRDTINMFAIDVVPTLDPSTIALKLYVNGTVETLTFLTGTGDTIAWPVTDSSPDGYNGIAFGAAGDTYGNQMAGHFDELFFHWGEITATQVAQMYALGTQ